MVQTEAKTFIDKISFNHKTAGEHLGDLWRDSLSSLFHVEPEFNNKKINDSFIDFYSLDNIICIDQKFSAASFVRDHKRIAHYDNDIIGLCLWLDGTNDVDNGGVQVSAKNSAFLMDFGKPINTQATSSRCLSLALPKPLLAQHGLNINKLGGLSLGSNNPKLAILRSTLQSTFKALPQIKKDQSESVSHALAALVGGLFNTSDETLSNPTLDAAIRHTIIEYIQHHLANPGLNINLIAKALPYSRSTLYRHFSTEDGIANYIRLERLKRCYKAIASPSNQSVSVMAIARSWGFSNSSHFSRLFRQYFGLSPTDVREKSLYDKRQSLSDTADDKARQVTQWFLDI